MTKLLTISEIVPWNHKLCTIIALIIMNQHFKHSRHRDMHSGIYKARGYWYFRFSQTSAILVQYLL